MASLESLPTPDLLTSSLLDGTEANLLHWTSPSHHPSAQPSWLSRVTKLVQQPLQQRPVSYTPAGVMMVLPFHWQWRHMAFGTKRPTIPSPGWHPLWPFTSLPVVAENYGHLNMALIWSIARAILPTNLATFCFCSV